MTFEDHCKFSLSRYASLYSGNTWEKCKFLIAHQCFIVLGNGMEWHFTRGKNAYLADWCSKPKAYGRVKFSGEYEKYINSEIVRYNNKSILRSEVPKGIPEFSVYLKTKFKTKDFSLEGDQDKYYMKDANLGDKKSNYDYKSNRPYPNFNKTYSPAWEIEPNLIAPDWREAMLKHHEYWLKYYTNNPDAYCHIGKASEYLDRWVALPVEKVQKDWQIPIWNGTNVDDCVKYLQNEYKEQCRVFCSETVERLK